MTLELTGCPVCGDAKGDCNDVLIRSALVLQGSTGSPVGSGQFKSGKFYTTRERIIRNNHLVHGIGAVIPWEEAVALGLIEGESPPPPPVMVIPDEQPDGDDGEDDTPQVVNPAAMAAVRRRNTKTGAAKLGKVK